MSTSQGNPRSKGHYAVVIFLILTACYSFFTPVDNWNSQSRLNLVWSIVDHGVVNIDAFHENTQDKAYSSGHYYTDKSIGPSMLGVPTFLLYRKFTSIPFVSSLLDIESVSYAGAVRIITLFSTVLPSVVLGVVFFIEAARHTSQHKAFALTLAYGLATIAFPYSFTLFQHQLAAVGLFIGFVLIWRLLDSLPRTPGYTVVGLLFGFVSIAEPIAVVPMAGMALWVVISTRSIRPALSMALGAAPWLLVFVVYNLLAYGTPIAFGYTNVANGWDAVQGQGVMGLVFPSLDRLWGITFSSFRGLFFFSPFLLLGFWGLARLARSQVNRFAPFMILLVLTTFFVYNSAYLVWWGGYSIGPRHLTPAVPFLAFSIVYLLEHPKRSRLIWRTFLGLSLVSALIIWIMILGSHGFPPDTAIDYPADSTEPYPTWMLAQMQARAILANPLVDYALVNLRSGDVAPNLGSEYLDMNGFASLLPLVLVVTVVLAGLVLLPAFNTRTRKTITALPEDYLTGPADLSVSPQEP